jgi:hypothetical protein
MKEQLLTKSVLDAWTSHVSRVDQLLDKLSDEQLQREVSPGRNTGTYLLGHLVAVHDRMLPLLGLGERKYTHLDDAFINSPDKSGKEMPSIAELRSDWKAVNAELAKQFSTLQPSDWFQRHTSVSEEDFAKEPHRNRLSVLISRTNHLAEHRGQMLFLEKK